MKLVPSVLVVLGLVGAASADPLDDAVARAKAEHKPLVVEIGATWCGPCKVFKDKGLVDPRVQAALPSVVFEHYDADVGAGEAVALRLGITTFPSFLIMDQAGKIMKRWEGLPGMEDGGAAQFLQIIAASKMALDTEATVFARLKAHPGDVGIELDAARWYVARKLPHEAISHFDGVANNPRANPPERAEALEGAAHWRRVLAWRERLISDKVSLLRAQPALAQPDDLLIATVGSTLPPDEAKQLVATVLAAQTDDDQLNELVYIALAANAYDAALAGAEKVAAHNHTPGYIDTLAEVHHARGEREAALELEDEALAGAPKHPTLVADRKRFATSRQDAPGVVAARARADLLRARFETADTLPDAPRMPAEDVRERAKRDRDAARLEREAIDRVVKQCRPDAGRGRKAFVTFVVLGDSVVSDASVTIYTDPQAPATLRGCIARTLSGARLPPASYEEDAAERTIVVRF